MANEKLTPKDYGRWEGKIVIIVASRPTENPKEDEYKQKVELVLQKQRNGEELTDDELDILFEQMSTEAAIEMVNKHTPTKNKSMYL